MIRRNHQTGQVSLDPLRWGLIPYWCEDPKGGHKPINAKCETVRTLPIFREAYRRRRRMVPVDGFFEWKAIEGFTLHCWRAWVFDFDPVVSSACPVWRERVALPSSSAEPQIFFATRHSPGR